MFIDKKKSLLQSTLVTVLWYGTANPPIYMLNTFVIFGHQLLKKSQTPRRFGFHLNSFLKKFGDGWVKYVSCLFSTFLNRISYLRVETGNAFPNIISQYIKEINTCIYYIYKYPRDIFRIRIPGRIMPNDFEFY